MRPSMDSEAIEQEAAGWFAKRASGIWTEADQARFDTWVGQKTAHRIAYIRLDTAWKQAACMQALGAGVPAGTIPSRGSWGDRWHIWRRQPKTQADGSNASEARRQRTSWLAMAASVLLCCGLYVYTSGVLLGDRYATEVGKVTTLPLADGSLVTLNTDSAIRVRFVDGQRRITLNRGEAFFDVAKDPLRPFIVSAGSSRVIAVGTKFSVRRDGADLRVAVTEGKVRVEGAAAEPQAPATAADSKGGASVGRAVDRAASEAVFLEAGSVARTSSSALTVREHVVTEIDGILSWRHGYVSFRDTSLEDAVKEFNRYHRRKMVIADPTIAKINIGGNFRTNNVDAFLGLLQTGFPVTVEQTGDEVVLRGR